MTDINKASQQLIKESNMKLVFGLIHSHGTISRADIKKITGLSATTVSSLVEELMADKLVVECGVKETKTSGRKAVMLTVNSQDGFFVGLDVRKNIIYAALCGLDFSVKQTAEVTVAKGETLVLGILRAIGSLARGKRVFAITIGIPGVIDPKTNTLISSTVLAAEDAKDMYLILRETMPDVSIFIKNNSGLMALCEREFDGYQHIDNLVSVDIDDGVGAGILIGGAIYDGSGLAGEFGHMSVDINGRRCNCGNYGCLELYASIPAMLQQSGADSVENLKIMLDANDAIASSAIDKVARALAFGINNIVNLLDPELIVIGGAVRGLGDVFLNRVQANFEELSLIQNKTIVYSEIDENPVVLGGVRYAFDMLFGM